MNSSYSEVRSIEDSRDRAEGAMTLIPSQYGMGGEARRKERQVRRKERRAHTHERSLIVGACSSASGSSRWKGHSRRGMSITGLSQRRVHMTDACMPGSRLRAQPRRRAVANACVWRQASIATSMGFSYVGAPPRSEVELRVKRPSPRRFAPRRIHFPGSVELELLWDSKRQPCNSCPSPNVNA